MPPNPTTKSWSAWFDAVLYHAEFYLLFEDFVEEELDRGRNTASYSLLRLEEMYQDERFMKKLGAQLKFLKVKAPTLMVYLNYFQERMPHATQAHAKMESLLQYLHDNAKVEEEDLEFCFDGGLTCQEKTELMFLFSSAFNDAHAKLYKYFVDGEQPASKFLEQIQLLDPRNLIDADLNFDSMDSIPGFEAVPRDEWNLYVNHLGPLAVKHNKDGKFDLALFWKSKESNLPELYKLASCYCTSTIGSCDVERSFSAYSEILDEKHRSLDESTIKAFHFLNWNLRMRYSNEQEREQQSKRKTAPSCSATLNESVKATPAPKRSLCKVREMSFPGCSPLRKKEFNIPRQLHKLKTPAPAQGKFQKRTKGRRQMDQNPNSARWRTKGRKQMKPLKPSPDPPSMHSLA